MAQRVWVVMGVVLALGGCGDDRTGISGARSPSIEVRDGELVLGYLGTVVVPDGGERRIGVLNTGNGDLEVRGIEISSEPAGVFTVAAAVTPSAAAPVVLAPGDAAWELTLRYAGANVPEGARPRATITLRTNTTVPEGRDSFVFYASPEQIVSKLVLQPPSLDFATVAPGTTSTRPLNVLNTGTAQLSIARVELVGDPGYSAVIEGVELRSGDAHAFSPPLVLPAGSARHVDVTFGAPTPTAARAELVFHSDDPGAPAGTRAPLYANLVGPCIRAIPPRLDFGGKRVGQASTLALELESCGDRELEITTVELVDDGGGVFTVDRSAVTLPKVVPAGERVAIPVTYVPEYIAAIGSDGQPVRDRGRVRVTSSAYLAALDVELSGFGGGCCCPVATIEVAEGDEVVVQTELHLSGAGSSVEGGEVKRWEWSVVQPAGSVSVFAPSAAHPAPTFTPNVIGTYIFRLDVYDADGQKSCAPAEYIVEVTSPDALHVELIWRTPGDADETDEGSSATSSVGSDLDLHFLYPFAVRFFDVDYDCYWLTPELEWLPPGPDGNPRLDRDDRDGGGPENLNMTRPEDGTTYRVGVHYFNDWGFGDAYATVRVYIEGVLRDQWKDVLVRGAELWESHTIAWPGGVVTRVTGDGGGPNITPGYPTR